MTIAMLEVEAENDVDVDDNKLFLETSSPVSLMTVLPVDFHPRKTSQNKGCWGILSCNDGKFVKPLSESSVPLDE